MLKKAARLLKEKGHVIIQIVNYDRILAGHIQELPTIDREWIQFYRTYEWRDPKILFHGRLTVQNQEEQQTFQKTTELSPLTSETLGQLLQGSGFQEIQLYGSYQGEAYEPDSPAIIVVAQK